MIPIKMMHLVIFWVSCQNRCSGEYILQEFARNDLHLNSTITELSIYSKSGYRSALECLAMCSRNKECVSIFYNTRSGVCTGHTVQFYTAEPRSPDEGSLYYTKLVDKRDCAEILDQNPDSPDGVYIINPLDGKGHFRVYCDMTTDDGGWTVFQRRKDGSEDFYRNWTDYKIGFGSLEGEFWLGNDNINRLTKTRSVQLRIHLGDHSYKSSYAKFSTFRVENESKQYRLEVSGYNGNAGNPLWYHNGMKFTTKDHDNDKRGDYNCAVKWIGAWWSNGCHKGNLNGMYGAEGYGKGIIWSTWRGQYYSLKETEMMLKPN